MVEPFNRAILLRRLGNNIGFVVEIVGLFEPDCGRLMGELRLALEKKDPLLLSQAAHTLKGALGSLSAGPAMEAALQLEVLGREGNLAGADAVYRGLETEITRLQAALADLCAGLPT